MGRFGWVVLCWVSACGSSYTPTEAAPAGEIAPPPSAPVYRSGAAAGLALGSTVEVAESDDVGYGGGDWDFEESSEPASVSDVVARPPVAQAVPTPQPAPSGQPPPSPPTANDARDTSGPILIYLADLYLGVYEVEATQDRIVEEMRELDGFLSRRTDTELVVRVPARRFREALQRIEGAGDVLRRNVEAQDVSEEFRDLAIRIRNAEAMRDRLERLLTRAENVEAALAIERELQRLTEELETMKGRQRFLADRIAFSTITVHFQPLNTEAEGPDGFVLPFPWLNQIGLSNLMRL
ncbi:MAG: DUF4349 domain-containing protein [Myxococcota bacterium]